MDKVIFERLVFGTGVLEGYIRPVEEKFTIEHIQDDLFVKVVGKENTTMITNCPHKKVCDMYLIPCVLVEENEEGLMHFAITNQLKKRLGVSDDELMAKAMLSSMNIFPDKIEPMVSFLADLISPEDRDLNPNLFVVTNEKNIFGAASLFYPGVMEKISLMVSGSFYVIPSSIHEFIVVTPDGRPNFTESLNSAIKDINRTVLKKEDVLSDHAYFYNHKKKVFESC